MRCDNKTRCVPKSWLCDGNADCSDKEDEQGCSKFQGTTLEHFKLCFSGFTLLLIVRFCKVAVDTELMDMESLLSEKKNRECGFDKSTVTCWSTSQHTTLFYMFLFKGNFIDIVGSLILKSQPSAPYLMLGQSSSNIISPQGTPSLTSSLRNTRLHLSSLLGAIITKIRAKSPKSLKMWKPWP